MFDTFDPILLARIQFAFTVAFHFIFPAFSIGLASFLAVCNGMWLATGRQVYLTLFQYWLKIFALSFAMGVVSGIVMSYQFGTNWSVFSDRTGPILGPMMGYEVLSAFFLEAGFLGVMLFGLNRVGKGLHFFATLMVAVGTLGSAFWILSVNSWMQTPVGYSVAANGQFVPEDWWAIVFNPSFPYRLGHTVLAAYLTTAFIVGAVGAFHLLRNRHNGPARKMFSMALWMATIVAPIQIFAGDAHGLNTLEHQPMKVAAMEGHFETNREGGMPLTLFGLPDMDEGRMRAEIGIPNVGSLILTHSLNGEVRGLDQFPREDWPNVWIVFFTFRIMVGIGFAMLGIGLWGLWRRWKGTIYDAPWLQRAMVAMGPSGLVAVICGWFTTEVGRQPYTVYGLLRTAESHSPIEAAAVGTSLVAFVLVYFAVFGAGTYYIMRLMGRGPSVFETGPDPREPIRTAGITPGPAMDTQEGPVSGARI
ncbi:cytochrome ubiquinol oxidase subunit I [Aureimonas sp. N4]|uniref:cytochrome ubiquinol oxidase subunit I n=1 Tax=Aureimonas sp. N4 TaxID=1638165 RepID=UPI000782A2DD|nr:cytochrome ubiquinol oxidase subunit I [Aureimonas sp. N4]